MLSTLASADFDFYGMEVLGPELSEGKVLFVTEIDVDGDDLEFGNNLRPNTIRVDRGDELEVEVSLWNAMDFDIEDAIMKVYFWYEDSDEEGVEDMEEVDLRAGDVESFSFRLSLPEDLPHKNLLLKVLIYDEDGDIALFGIKEEALENKNSIDDLEIEDLILIAGIPLTVQSREKEMIEVEDILLHPESRVQAGDLLTLQVRLKNIGEKDLDDVKVIAKIRNLEGAMDSIYVLEDDDGVAVPYDDDALTEPLSFYIDPCAKGQDYTLEVYAEFDDGDERSESATKSITIVESESSQCKDKVTAEETTVNIMGGTQILSASQKTAFPVIIENNADTSKAYTVSAEAMGDWADEVTVDETSVVLESGETKTVLVYATAKSGAQGKQALSIKVKGSDDEVIKQQTLEVSITGSSEGFTDKISFRRVLEVGLIVLVILLVLLGLIIGFNKLKEDEEDLEEEDKSYY